MTLRRLPMLPAMLLLLAPATLPAAGASARRPPRAVVKAFYSHHFQHDMGFTEESIRGKEPWLAPELFRACLAELASPRDPNEAPRINGDPFTDSQEYPTRFDVGPLFQPSPGVSRVPVTFKGNHLEKRVVVVLILSGDQWKVADVEDEHGGSLAFLLGTGLSVIRAR